MKKVIAYEDSNGRLHHTNKICKAAQLTIELGIPKQIARDIVENMSIVVDILNEPEPALRCSE